MIIMSVDLGDVRTGLAVCDTGESFVFPRGVIHERNRERLLEKICAAAKENGAQALVMGYPKNMNGSIGERAKLCEDAAEKLSKISGLSCALWDERCTTLSAHDILNRTDTRGKKRKNTVDAVAAVLILEDYLKSRKAKSEHA